MSNVALSTELKGLRIRRDEAVVESTQAKQRMLDSQKDYETKKKKLDDLNARIKQLEQAHLGGAGIVVTEHAYLRWFERAMGFDLEEVKKSMLSERTAEAIRALGSCRVKVDGGFTLVVKDRTVVSVLSDERADPQ
jgi:hypothetical protein